MIFFLELLFCHLIGDYVLQTNYISDAKKKNWWHLIVHCILYTLPFYVCFALSWHLGVIFVAHIIIDAVKARYELINEGVDQMLHIALLLIYFI